MQPFNRWPHIVFTLLAVIFTVLIALFGLLLLLTGWLKPLADLRLDPLLVGSFWGKFIGGGLVILAIVFTVVSILRLRREECIAFDNPEGEVIIALPAVEDYVRRLARTFSEVKELVPHITASDDGINIEVTAVLWDDASVHTTTEKIQQKIKSHIQSFFGLAKVHPIKVYIARTMTRESAAEPAEPPAGESESPEAGE